jgi:hypothetical protein
MGLAVSMLLTEEVLCEQNLLGRFCTFLAEYYVKDDDKHLMCGSSLQYLSGVFNSIQDRFPSNPNYTKSSLHPWYTELRHILEKKMSTIGGGDSIQVLPYRKSTSFTLSKLLRQNSPEAVYQLSNLNLQFTSGGGRTAEGAKTYANGSRWNAILGVYTVNWNQIKLRRQV